MAEMAVSLVVDKLIPLLWEEAKLFKGIHKKFADIKDELESIQAFLKDADKKAEGDNTNEGVKTWVEQVREVSFRIENIIDDYLIKVVPQPPDHPGFVALLHKLKTIIPRRQISNEIQAIKSSVIEISKRSKRYNFQRSLEQGSNDSRGSRNRKWHDPSLAALYIEEAEVVGFEVPRKTLIDWMVKGREERTVVSVVAMGGQGKTTLAKKVFDDKDIIRQFDCRVWITVSQSYTIEELLRDMVLKLYKQKGDNAPKHISQMDRASLIGEVRNYLQEKRYVVVFDDVWSLHFWDDIEFALIDNKNGSKILITTRNQDVIVSCKRSSFVEVLPLEPLTQEQSLELFNKKAFRFDYGGCCPKELIGIANEIVKKCKGLPLAIVAIGGLLCTREKNVFEWQGFIENLSSELKKDTHLIGINKILGLSYSDLPNYLKSCLLYFGIYPEDFEVNVKRVTRQWIAEGFVKEEGGKTLEEVAEGYLTELIHRSLVQVSSVEIDGKVKCCRVHDLICNMILEKIEDLKFCKHISEDGQSSLSGITRRLSILTSSNDMSECIDSLHIRSLLDFTNNISLDYFANIILTKYRLLKVLHFEFVGLLEIPDKLGNLNYLKYLSIRRVNDSKLPKSIGMLQNLETLEVRDTHTIVLPKEISKLRKLRHLIGLNLSLVQLKDGIGEMTSLQTLDTVVINIDGAVDVIKELGKLKQIRVLGLCLSAKYGSILSSSLNEMQHLEILNVTSSDDKVIDLELNSSRNILQNLTLCVRLRMLPEWIPELQNLVVLKLKKSYLTKDPMQSLKCLQNLLKLTLDIEAYDGLHLHVEAGGFRKLKELFVERLFELQDIIIDKGALPSLEKLTLSGLNSLKNIPTGIKHLEKLEALRMFHMPIEFVDNISTYEDWIREPTPKNVRIPGKKSILFKKSKR